MPDFKFSIVQPSFNQGRFIYATIKSILGWGYSNLGYVLVDAGSTDDSVEIIPLHTHSLHYFVSKPDTGHANAP